MDKVKDLMSLKTEKESQSGALVSGMKAMKNSLLRESKDSKTSRVEEVQACVQSLFEPGNDFQSDVFGNVVAC